MTLVPTPKVNAMLICDHVITEQGSRKKSLIGIFENISAPKFPCLHHFLSVYIKLTDAQGTYRFRLELVDLQNDKMIGKGVMPEPVTFRDPLRPRDLVFNLTGVKFPQAGDYEFRIFANDKIFGQKSFSVSEGPKKHPPTKDHQST